MTRIQNSIEINAGFDVVFDMTNDIENWPNLFTEYKEALVIQKDDNYILFRLTTFPDEDQKTYSWISERRLDRENKKIHARRVDHLFPFQSMDIQWLYEEKDGRTEMVWTQDFEVDPSSGFTEQQVVDHLNQTSRVQMEAIKTNLEKILAY
ncbi:SRPBCC family protein [Gorillibacterium sp. CAU 1737]|uniref:SRPBCC family protein n=1 Tax=Gorillibacterium sp. CAU 1737 TaxID=3140362 RepID=UPI00326167AD